MQTCRLLAGGPEGLPPTPKGAMDSDKKKYQQFLQGAFEKYKNTSQDVMIKFR